MKKPKELLEISKKVFIIDFNMNIGLIIQPAALKALMVKILKVIFISLLHFGF